MPNKFFSVYDRRDITDFYRHRMASVKGNKSAGPKAALERAIMRINGRLHKGNPIADRLMELEVEIHRKLAPTLTETTTWEDMPGILNILLGEVDKGLEQIT